MSQLIRRVGLTVAWPEPIDRPCHSAPRLVYLDGLSLREEGLTYRDSMQYPRLVMSVGSLPRFTPQRSRTLWQTGE